MRKRKGRRFIQRGLNELPGSFCDLSLLGRGHVLAKQGLGEGQAVARPAGLQPLTSSNFAKPRNWTFPLPQGERFEPLT